MPWLLNCRSSLSNCPSWLGGVTQLESGFGDVAALKREVSTLIEIERDNLTDLFEAQLALQQAQMSSDGIEETAPEPEKVYPEGTIVFPPSATQQ